MKDLTGFFIDKHFYFRALTRIFAVPASNIEEYTFRPRCTFGGTPS